MMNLEEQKNKISTHLACREYADALKLLALDETIILVAVTTKSITNQTMSELLEIPLEDAEKLGDDLVKKKLLRVDDSGSYAHDNAVGFFTYCKNRDLGSLMLQRRESTMQKTMNNDRDFNLKWLSDRNLMASNQSGIAELELDPAIYEETRDLTVDAARDLTVDAARDLTVDAARDLTVDASRSHYPKEYLSERLPYRNVLTKNLIVNSQPLRYEYVIKKSFTRFHSNPPIWSDYHVHIFTVEMTFEGILNPTDLYVVDMVEAENRLTLSIDDLPKYVNEHPDCPAGTTEQLCVYFVNSYFQVDPKVIIKKVCVSENDNRNTCLILS